MLEEGATGGAKVRCALGRASSIQPPIPVAVQTRFRRRREESRNRRRGEDLADGERDLAVTNCTEWYDRDCLPVPPMHGHNTFRPGRVLLGLFLGVLLIAGPLAQSIAAAHGPCGPAEASSSSSSTAADVETLADAVPQWTCSDRSYSSVLRARPSDRPDGSSLEGKPLPTQGADSVSQSVLGRTVRPNAVGFISPVLLSLRPVVLLI